MMIYSAGTIQIYILGLRGGSVLSVVKTGKQSLFPLCDHVLTHKIFLLMQAQKVEIFGFKVTVYKITQYMFFNRFFETLMIAKYLGEISKPLKIFEITSNSC